MKLILISFCFISLISAEDVFTCFLHRNGWCYFEDKTIGYDVKSRFIVFNSANDFVKNVVFELSLIREVPGGIFTSFSNLERLRIIGQHVEDIYSKTFTQAKKLKTLNLSLNKIKRLKSGALEGAWNLEEFFMCCGLLVEINRDSLKGLSKLRTLSFSGNQLKSIHKFAFEDLLNLRTIALNSNQLTFIHKDLFANNVNLEVIYLNENKFSAVSNTMFSHIFNLKFLYLKDNDCINKDYPEYPAQFPVARTQFSSIESDLLNCTTLYEYAELIHNSDH